MTSQQKYMRTKKGILASIYGHQRHSSKRRGHIMPTYSKEELGEWLFSHKDFDTLYGEWICSGYLKETKPSVDRIDDSIGYSLSNIQLLTWDGNRVKACNDQFIGKLICTHRKVIQLSIDGVEICEYNSASEASRVTGARQQLISACCLGKRNKTSGFKWKYSPWV